VCRPTSEGNRAGLALDAPKSDKRRFDLPADRDERRKLYCFWNVAGSDSHDILCQSEQAILHADVRSSAAVTQLLKVLALRCGKASGTRADDGVTDVTGSAFF